jgi:hypothetical protein
MRYALKVFKTLLAAILLTALSGALLVWAAYEKWFPFGSWRYIVVHHSATPSGSAASFDDYHRKRGIYGGLAYHFVIGNGRGMSDGSVAEGHRWTRSQAGGHVTPNAWNYNVFGIGICLVGNQEKTSPTVRQWHSLVKLVTRLAREYRIPPENILGHTEVPWYWRSGATERTACPGRHLDLEVLRRQVHKHLATTEGY